ncbi:hypothetical protein PspLS_00212 [Pyricularia sp. CBS 133598]|nr:hypothetical protein PspLS_00212 [Pyricularia sp. CBS 133598]
MAGLLNGVGGLVGDTVGSVTVPLLGQEKGGNRNGNDDNETVRPPRGGLLAPAPSASASPSPPPDRNSAADGPGLIQVSAPNLLPTLPLLNGGNSRSTAVPTSSARTTARSSTTAVPSSSSAPTSVPTNTPTPPAPTPDPEPTSIPPTSPPQTTPLAPLPTTLDTIATPLPSTSSVPNVGQGLGAPPLATPSAAQSQAGGGFVMDPTKNPVMMALVIAVPIGLALIIGITVLLFKKGCLGSGRRKGRVIKDEIEHEAWQKVHAQKFGPSANY